MTISLKTFTCERLRICHAGGHAVVTRRSRGLCVRCGAGMQKRDRAAAPLPNSPVRARLGPLRFPGSPLEPFSPRFLVPPSSTYQKVKARIWPWLSSLFPHASLESDSSCSLPGAEQRTATSVPGQAFLSAQNGLAGLPLSSNEENPQNISRTLT